LWCCKGQNVILGIVKKAELLPLGYPYRAREVN